MRLCFDPAARTRPGRAAVALLAATLALGAGCNSLDGIESPEAPGANGSDTGSSVCGVSLPCADETGTVTCVGSAAAVTCEPTGMCDPGDHLELPCTGSAGCGGGVCCAALATQSLAGGQDCFASLSATPGEHPSSSCQAQACPTGELQLCSSDAQCEATGGAGLRCAILVIGGSFEVSIGYCAGPFDGG